MEYRMRDTPPPSEEIVARAMSLFAAQGIHVVKGG
jgi:hypothetical protein